MERPSHGSIAGEASQRVHSIISAAEHEAAAMRRDAERECEAILRRAEDEREQIIAGARGRAEEVVRERMRLLSELSDQLVERTEMLLERMEGTAHVRRQLESLTRVLGEAAEAVAREAGTRGYSGPPREEPPRPRQEQPLPPPRHPPRDEVIPPPAPGRARPNPPPARGDQGADSQLDGARLVALQMAVAGSSREEVAAELRRTFDLQDPSPILESVFGESGPRRASATR